MRSVLDVSTSDGDVEIREEELETITEEDLKRLEITREELRRCFEEGKRLMKERGITESDRIRPVAGQLVDRTWEVMLVRYSPVSDPLMDEARKAGEQTN